MQIWTMHNEARFALVFAEGPVVLWEFHNCSHLHVGNEQVDEYRDAPPVSFFAAGPRQSELIANWSSELAEVVRLEAGSDARLAVDHLGFHAADALREAGVQLVNGQSLMEEARLIKSDDELCLMRYAHRVCDSAIWKMHSAARPGISETELWAVLHHENISNGGEWIETRLLSSGERTNPWMREASEKRLVEGELLSFDTDLIGPFGYCADVSRCWTVGHTEPSAKQRELYKLAHEQIRFNMSLLSPGRALSDISREAWPIPPRYYKNRYSYLMHGVGMADEYPGVAHWGVDWERSGYDLELKENMVLCVESFIGAESGGEGVKLEQPVRLTADGVEELSQFPWNEDWL